MAREVPGDGPIVYLAGGLGNQLFMLAAGHAIAERYDTPLYVDTSFFSAQKLRKPEILDLQVAAIPLGHMSPLRSARVLGRRITPLPRRLSALKRPPLLDVSMRRDPRKILDTGPNRTLIGYFQSFSYFPGTEPVIADWLNSSNASSLSPFQNSEAPEKFVAVHIRRGDLAKNPKHAKLLNTSEYFSAATLELPDSAKDLPIVVFTDSETAVEEEIANKMTFGARAVSFFDASGKSSAQVIVAMSKAEHFVMSTSTFGFWATWLAHTSRPNQIFAIAPRAMRRFWERVDAGFRPNFV